jgi:hypothetical protein
MSKRGNTGLLFVQKYTYPKTQEGDFVLVNAEKLVRDKATSCAEKALNAGKFEAFNKQPVPLYAKTKIHSECALRTALSITTNFPFKLQPAGRERKKKRRLSVEIILAWIKILCFYVSIMLG